LSGIPPKSFPATKTLLIILTGAMAMRPATLRELIDLCH
jgi:hypothetical protein